MSRTGVGAVIGLNAIGRQDQILCNLDTHEKDASPFYKEYTQWGHYTKFYKSYVRTAPVGSNTWPFTGTGERVGFIIDPKISGDLLTNLHIVMDLPALTDGGIWTDKIGRALIKSVEFKVDTVTVEKLDDLGLVFKDELFTTEHDNAVRNYCQNGQLYMNTLIQPQDFVTNPDILPLSPDHRSSALHLYINLGFCFGRTHSYRPEPFPMAAVFNQKIYVDIEFKPKTWFTNSNTAVYAPQVTLVTEQVTLSDQERLYIQRRPFSIRYKMVERMKSAQTDKTAQTTTQNTGVTGSAPILTLDLESGSPVSTIGWFFQNRRFINTLASDTLNSNLFLNRFNFSSHENYSCINPLSAGYVGNYYGYNEYDFPVCSQTELLHSKHDVKLLYSGSENVNIPSTSIFFRDIFSQTKGLFRPHKNIFSYSFEENPLRTEESGSSEKNINDYKLFLKLINSTEVTANVFDVYVYTVCYKSLNFENGNLIKKM